LLSGVGWARGTITCGWSDGQDREKEVELHGGVIAAGFSAWGGLFLRQSYMQSILWGLPHGKDFTRQPICIKSELHKLDWSNLLSLPGHEIDLNSFKVIFGWIRVDDMRWWRPDSPCPAVVLGSLAVDIVTGWQPISTIGK
jgi:hypothetical protein